MSRISNTPNNEVKLSILAESILFEHKFNNIIRQINENRYILTEEEQGFKDEDLESFIKQIAGELEQSGKIENAPDQVDMDKLRAGQKADVKQEIKEFDLTTTLLLSAPTLLKLLAKAVDWTVRNFGMSKEELKKWKTYSDEYYKAKKSGELAKMSKEQQEQAFGYLWNSKASKLIASLAEKLHHIYVGSIQAVLASIGWLTAGISWKDAWKSSEPIANKIYAGIMLALAGYGAVHAVSNLPGLAATITNLSSTAPDLAIVAADTIKATDMAKTLISAAVK